MKQFIIHLNDQKITDKKFILEDLDGTHLLIRGEARDEISRKVDEWMDMVSWRAGGRACVCVCGATSYTRILLYALCDFLACTVGVRFRIAGHYLIDTFMIPIRLLPPPSLCNIRMSFPPSRGSEKTWTHHRDHGPRSTSIFK